MSLSIDRSDETVTADTPLRWATTALSTQSDTFPFKMLTQTTAETKEYSISTDGLVIPPPQLSAKKTFSCEIEVYLKESNAYGNVYFSNYFNWQGVCREKWFKTCLFPNMFEVPGVFITQKASIHYIKEVIPFQTVIAKLNTSNLRKASVDLNISFYSESNELLASGCQTIVFADQQKKITRFPQDIHEKLADYQLT